MSAYFLGLSTDLSIPFCWRLPSNQKKEKTKKKKKKKTGRKEIGLPGS